MNEFNFCYWLQGLLEIVKPIELDSNQVKLIKAHLELVEDRDGVFCNWLDGFLDFNGENGWDKESLVKVQKKLSEEFYKIIDLSYDEKIQETLNQIHKNGLKQEDNNSGFEAMC